MVLLSLKCIKIFKTCNLYLCYIALGLCIAVLGPCILDLQHIVNTSTQYTAYIYTSRSVAYLIGAVVGGIILDAVKSKQAVMCIFSFIAAATMFGIPWSRNLYVLISYMVINGFCLGATEIGGSVICLRLWGGESGPYYQALHFNFGLGCLVSPLIAVSFLGDYNIEEFTLTNDNAPFSFNSTSQATELFNSSTSNTTYEGIPKIVYPFSAIGAFGMLVTVLFLLITMISPTEESTSYDENKLDAKEDCGFISSVVVINFLLLFMICGAEFGYAQMLTIYAVKGPLKLSASTGSYMTSAFWAAFTISRLTGVLLAIKLSNLTLIVYDLIVTSIGGAVLFFFVSYEWSLWIASILLGVGIASFFAASIGWLNDYITITNKIASSFTVSGALSQITIPYIIGIFTVTTTKVFVYIIPVLCILAVLIALILYGILRKRQKKEICQKQTASVKGNSTAHA